MTQKKRFDEVSPKADFPAMELKIIEFWRENNAFRKSLDLRKQGVLYTFYDGPPFATGLPHYGHILAGTIKDVIPRYQTMLGRSVPRRFGWDCHGVPVEHEMEKQLGFKNREDIERFGIKEFCEACRGIVLKHTAEWEKTVERMGRWVDFRNDYKTMDPDYMESILWVFSELWKKGLIYEGEKVVAYSPKLASTLSNFEANLNYKDIDDPAVTIKFQMTNDELQIEGSEAKTYLLAWTTTPWTLPSNLALAVNPKLEYVAVKTWNPEEKTYEKFILAKSIYERIRDSEKTGDELYIKLIQPYAFKKEEGKEPVASPIVTEFLGSDLVGKHYKPLFPFFENHENAFRVLAGDFVTEAEGTGIVHLAPAFGEDDANTCQQNNIKPVNPIDKNGYFDETIPQLAGKYFRSDPIVEGSKENNANDWVINQLKQSGQLVKREQIRHSYPHCWRTDSALMYRGVHTFFVNVQKIKEKLIKKNADINWIPEHLKHGRFGKMLESAPDWAISRSRYWGAPIPVWKCEKCNYLDVAGSIREIAEKAYKPSSFFIARHAEGEHNKLGVISSNINDNTPLTEKGIEQAKELGQKLADKKIELIYCSPFLRAKQTAEIAKQTAGITAEIVTDERLKEIDAGTMHGKKLDEWIKQYPSLETRFFENPHQGESSEMVEKRIVEFLQEMREKHPGNNIFIVTHGEVVRRCLHYFYNIPRQKTYGIPVPTASFYEFSFAARPENDNKEIDLHRPYIDQIQFSCTKCGGSMNRVLDVLDCWFESGSMPYASGQLPVDSRQLPAKEISGFPADFIAEGLDQTRGWFYTLHVLANALYQSPAFKNVVVNGIVLAEDGQKMSKSKKNYPDPQLIFDKYGADAMRFYLMNSPVVRAEDFRFCEEGVAEVLRKVILPLWNAYSFFVTYANIDKWTVDSEQITGKQTNKLDCWILAELGQLVRKFREKMDAYELEAACREIPEFLDKLTNFYIRRSRRRFWKSEVDEDKNFAFQTLHEVLITLVKVMAPITPFVTETMWRNLRNPEEPESVHHVDFPNGNEFADDPALRGEMDAVRTIISLALAVRAKKKIRVRQPLAELKVALPPHIPQAAILGNAPVIAEEINVKEFSISADPAELAERFAKPDARKLGPKFGKEVQDIIREAKAGNFITTDDGIVVAGKWNLLPEELEIGFVGKAGLDVESEKGIVVALDTVITETLRQEGIARELIRHVQEMRKDAGYDIADRIQVGISGAKGIISTYGQLIAGEVLADSVQNTLADADIRKDVDVEGFQIRLAIKR